jgi:hypothetical protein
MSILLHQSPKSHEPAFHVIGGFFNFNHRILKIHKKKEKTIKLVLIQNQPKGSLAPDQMAKYEDRS